MRTQQDDLVDADFVRALLKDDDEDDDECVVCEPPPQTLVVPASSSSAAAGDEEVQFLRQTGLRALIVAAGTGADTTPAALTLWREFHGARASILAVLEPDRLAA